MTTPENKNSQKSAEQAKQAIAKTLAAQQTAASNIVNSVATKSTDTAASNLASTTANAMANTTANVLATTTAAVNNAAKVVKKADNVVSMSQTAVNEKASENFAQASEKMAHTFDIASRLMNETLSIGREQVAACIEASTITAECAQKIGESLYQSTNAAISQNVEHYKHLFNCRTASDVIELQTRIAQANIERFFGNNSQINSMLLNFSTKASEPFAEKLSDASERFKRIFK